MGKKNQKNKKKLFKNLRLSEMYQEILHSWDRNRGPLNRILEDKNLLEIENMMA